MLVINLDPVQEQQELLSTEPSLHPLFFIPEERFLHENLDRQTHPSSFQGSILLLGKENPLELSCESQMDRTGVAMATPP